LVRMTAIASNALPLEEKVRQGSKYAVELRRHDHEGKRRIRQTFFGPSRFAARAGEREFPAQKAAKKVGRGGGSDRSIDSSPAAARAASVSWPPPGEGKTMAPPPPPSPSRPRPRPRPPPRMEISFSFFFARLRDDLYGTSEIVWASLSSWARSVQRREGEISGDSPRTHFRTLAAFKQAGTPHVLSSYDWGAEETPCSFASCNCKVTCGYTGRVHAE